jgi:hypothetical protein
MIAITWNTRIRALRTRCTVTEPRA